MPGRLRHAVGAASAIAVVTLAGAQSASAATTLTEVAARADAPVSELASPTVVTVPGGSIVQRYQQRVEELLSPEAALWLEYGVGPVA